MHDINNDNHLDIVTGEYSSNNIYVSFGYGNHRFSTQTVYSNEWGSYWFGMIDLNNDNHEDLLSFSRETLLIDVVLYKCDCAIY